MAGDPLSCPGPRSRHSSLLTQEGGGPQPEPHSWKGKFLRKLGLSVSVCAKALDRSHPAGTRLSIQFHSSENHTGDERNVSGHFQLQAGTLAPARAVLGENNPSARGPLSFKQHPGEPPDLETRTSTTRPALQATALQKGQAGALWHPDTDPCSRDHLAPHTEWPAASSRRPPRRGQEHPAGGPGSKQLTPSPPGHGEHLLRSTAKAGLSIRSADAANRPSITHCTPLPFSPNQNTHPETEGNQAGKTRQ